MFVNLNKIREIFLEIHKVQLYSFNKFKIVGLCNIQEMIWTHFVPTRVNIDLLSLSIVI